MESHKCQADETRIEFSLDGSVADKKTFEEIKNTLDTMFDYVRVIQFTEPQIAVKTLTSSHSDETKGFY